MTRQDFFNYLISKGCKVITDIPEGRANIVIIYNPNFNRRAFLNSPIDEREIREKAIEAICSVLGVELPQL